jgi:hypothetical protein
VLGSGLWASHELRAAGVEVIHVEANHQIGGRVRPLVDPSIANFPIELGAEECVVFFLSFSFFFVFLPMSRPCKCVIHSAR